MGVISKEGKSVIKRNCEARKINYPKRIKILEEHLSGKEEDED